MDRRIRKLERSGDPELMLRAGQLRCKVEGHVHASIENVFRSYEPWEQATRFTIRRSDNLQHDVMIFDRDLTNALFRGQPIDRFKYDLKLAARALSTCTRCKEPIETNYYNDIIAIIEKDFIT